MGDSHRHRKLFLLDQPRHNSRLTRAFPVHSLDLCLFMLKVKTDYTGSMHAESDLSFCWAQIVVLITHLLIRYLYLQRVCKVQES